MTLEAIAALGNAGAAAGSQSLVPLVLRTPVPVSTETAFDSLVSGLQDLNASMMANQRAVADLALGNTEGLEAVMLNLERTRLQFDVLMSVRNRVLEAYQEIMRMQV